MPRSPSLSRARHRSLKIAIVILFLFCLLRLSFFVVGAVMIAMPRDMSERPLRRSGPGRETPIELVLDEFVDGGLRSFPI